MLVAHSQYIIQHRPGSKIDSADALSRLPLSDPPTIQSSSGEINLLINQLSEAIVTASQIKAWTEKGIHYGHEYIIKCCMDASSDANLQPYFNRCDELCVTDGCVLWDLVSSSHTLVVTSYWSNYMIPTQV